MSAIKGVDCTARVAVLIGKGQRRKAKGGTSAPPSPLSPSPITPATPAGQIGFNISEKTKGENKTKSELRNKPGGAGVLGFSFAGYVSLASQCPCPIIVYFVASYRPHLSHFLGKCNFWQSQLSHSLFMHLLSRTECKCNVIVTFNKQQLSELFNRDYFESLLNRISYPKNPKVCDPILVTLLKMQPHSSQSSGTSPLASYKEVPPPPHPRGK